HEVLGSVTRRDTPADPPLQQHLLAPRREAPHPRTLAIARRAEATLHLLAAGVDYRPQMGGAGNTVTARQIGRHDGAAALRRERRRSRGAAAAHRHERWCALVGARDFLHRA